MVGTKLLVLYFILLTIFSAQANTDLYIPSDCESYELHHVNNDETYTIIWNGGDIPLTCSIGFIGRDDGYMNEYKVCFEAEEFTTDCGLRVKYEKGFNSIVSQQYSCNDYPSRWCGDSDDYVDISFTSDSVSSPDGNIRLKVTAKMTYNYNLTVGLAVGGTMAGVCIFITILVILTRARRNRGSIIRNPVVITAGIPVNTANAGTPNPVFLTSSGSYPTSVQSKVSEPPPSYQSVVSNTYTGNTFQSS